MAVICGIVTAAIFQLIIGLGYTAFSVYMMTIVGIAIDKSGADYFAVIAVAGLWISVVAFGATSLFAGIIGCIAGCQRGQCVVLTYMVSSTLSCLSSLEMIITSALFTARMCSDGIKNCTETISGIHLLALLGCSALIFFVSLIGSGFSCRARCYCCASEERFAGNEDPNRMELASPSAPPFNQLQ